MGKWRVRMGGGCGVGRRVGVREGWGSGGGGGWGGWGVFGCGEGGWGWGREVGGGRGGVVKFLCGKMCCEGFGGDVKG